MSKAKEVKKSQETQAGPVVKTASEKIIRFEPPVKIDTKTGKLVISDQWKAAVIK